jgi:hypothetical protein
LKFKLKGTKNENKKTSERERKTGRKDEKKKEI